MKVEISYQVFRFRQNSTYKLEISDHHHNCPARPTNYATGPGQVASQFHILISNCNQGPRQEREVWQRSRRSYSLYQTTTRSFKTVLTPCPFHGCQHSHLSNIPLTELQTTISARQTLESQLAENRAVSAEFSTLSDSSNIYKLIGPVLLKQDKTDAVASVNGRLEFIEKEIKRTEGRIKELQEGSEKKRGEVMSLQQKMLAGQQGQAQVKV